MIIRQLQWATFGVLSLCNSWAFANDTSQALSAEALQIIKQYNMQHIPHEGPYFLQTAKSDEPIGGELATRYEGTRYAYTAILSMLTKADFSALHKLNTDEIWHFYAGAPAEILMLHPNGKQEVVIFSNQITQGQHPQIVVPRGVWMGARLLSNADKDFTFFGTTMAPGFEYQDYIPGHRDSLLQAYPEQAERIIALTRPDKDAELKNNNNAEDAQPPLHIEEIIGLNGPVINAAMSVAKVSMAANTELPLSYNKENTEVVIVISGSGSLTIADKPTELTPNAVVLLPPKVKYQFKANSDLVFYAIVTPAFEPSDHVELKE